MKKQEKQTMNSKKPKEFYLDVTQEDVDELRAKGVDEDAIPKVGRHKFTRGGFMKRHNLKPEDFKDAKVRITMLVDVDVLKYFKERSKHPGALPYQTQMNQVLRAEMEHSAVDQLVHNEQFIQAVAQRLLNSIGALGKKRKTA
jgi:uncharacterized protein (DUF4415 family)